MKTQAPANKSTNAAIQSPFFQKQGAGHFFGNQSDSFFKANGIQTKLTVNAPGDVYEREADAMAGKVVQRLAQPSNTPENGHGALIQTKFTSYSTANASYPVQTKCAECEKEEKLQEKELGEKPEKDLQKKAIFESNAEDDDTNGTNIQRKCAACEHEEVKAQRTSIQRKCSECEKEETSVQKKDNANGAHSAPTSIESQVHSTRGKGSAMPDQVRSQMENAFGYDFGGVRIHHDSQSAQMNRELSSHAFTHGNDIYFNTNTYNTNTSSGKYLLAHELTHTIQQGNGIQMLQRDASDYVPGFVKDAASTAGGLVSSGADALSGLVTRAQNLGVSVAKEAGELAGKALDWLETQAGNALRSVVESLGGTITITQSGLQVHIPGQQICNPHEFAPQPEEHRMDLTVPIPLIPFGPLILAGEIGPTIIMTPQFLFQIGPCFLTGVDLLVNPATSTYSIKGGVSIALSASVGGELRIGGRGALALYIIIPDPPMLLRVPIVGLELGGAALIQGLAATNLTFERGLAYSGGAITFDKTNKYDLGLALNAYLGAYGQLDVLNQDLCRIYWPLYEWHPNTALSFESSNSMTLSGLTGGGLMASSISSSKLKSIPFSDLKTALWIPGFTDYCPIKDLLCKIGYALRMMPSQRGGSWKGHPAPPYSGPLNSFPRKPPIPSGAECRGACGPDCNYCNHLGVVSVCETLPGELVRDWTYPGYEQCGSHSGCREHDAAFDWCAAGGEMSMWGPCHMLANLECTCSNQIHECVGWIFGKRPFDSLMEFSAPPVPGPIYPGECPCAISISVGGGGTAGATGGGESEEQAPEIGNPDNLDEGVVPQDTNGQGAIQKYDGVIQMLKGPLPGFDPTKPIPGLDPFPGLKPPLKPSPPVIPTPVPTPTPTPTPTPQPTPQPSPMPAPIITIIPKLTKPPVPVHGKMPAPQPQYSTKPALKLPTNCCIGKSKPKKKRRKKGTCDKTGATYTWQTPYNYKDMNGILRYCLDSRNTFFPHAHHVWPKFMGGPDKQKPRLNVESKIHLGEFHGLSGPVGPIHVHITNFLNAHPVYRTLLKGNPVTNHTSDPGNQILIKALRKDKTLRSSVRSSLSSYYDHYNADSDPILPTWAYNDGLRDAESKI